MHHFHTLPRPDLILPAFAHLLQSPEGFTGSSQMEQAVFFGQAIAATSDNEDFIMAIMRSMSELVERAAHVASPDATAERREGLLFIVLQAEEAGAAGMEDVGTKLADDLLTRAKAAAEAGEEGTTATVVEAFQRRVRCIVPENEGDRFPMDPLSWPVPILGGDEERAFYQGARQTDNPPWARSAFHVSMAVALRESALAELAGEQPREQATKESGGSEGGAEEDDEGTREKVLSPVDWEVAAAQVSCDTVDALWANFYATGDPSPVRKVCLIASKWLDFQDEYGEAVDPDAARRQADALAKVRELEATAKVDPAKAEAQLPQVSMPSPELLLPKHIVQRPELPEELLGSDPATARKRHHFEVARHAANSIITHSANDPVVLGLLEQIIAADSTAGMVAEARAKGEPLQELEMQLQSLGLDPEQIAKDEEDPESKSMRQSSAELCRLVRAAVHVALHLHRRTALRHVGLHLEYRRAVQFAMEQGRKGPAAEEGIDAEIMEHKVLSPTFLTLAAPLPPFVARLWAEGAAGAGGRAQALVTPPSRLLREQGTVEALVQLASELEKMDKEGKGMFAPGGGEEHHGGEGQGEPMMQAHVIADRTAAGPEEDFGPSGGEAAASRGGGAGAEVVDAEVIRDGR